MSTPSVVLELVAPPVELDVPGAVVAVAPVVEVVVTSPVVTVVGAPLVAVTGPAPILWAPASVVPMVPEPSTVPVTVFVGVGVA